MRSRWIPRFAWGSLLLSSCVGLINRELLWFHGSEALFYAALLWLLASDRKASLFFGLAIGSVWLVVHVGLTRWVATSAFSLWIDWKTALETNPAGVFSMALAFLNLSLASDCFYAYLKCPDKHWSDLKIFAGSVALILFLYLIIFWLFQRYWLDAILSFGIF
jgi:hypothetical protein